MSSEIFLPWRWFSTARPTTRRRFLATKFAAMSSEALEARCLLSASSGHGSGGQMGEAAVDADLKQGRANDAHSGRKAVFPNMAGTWELITHTEGVDIHGILVIQQHGKRLTGTLTNDSQPPGSFKAKFILDKGKLGAIKGKVVNRAVDSNGVPIESPVHDDHDDWDGDGDGNFGNDPDSMHGTLGNSPEGATFDATHTVFDD